MNFRSSAAAFLAAVIAAPAQAAVYTPSQVEMMVNSLEATKAVRSYDVPVNVLAECPDFGSDQARFYHGRRPRIDICAPKMDSPFDVQETVQHEAIHMAQWCAGVNSVYVISSLKSQGDEYKADIDFAHKMASDYYAPSQYDSEFEAYYFMDTPGSQIAEMVHDACK